MVRARWWDCSAVSSGSACLGLRCRGVRLGVRYAGIGVAVLFGVGVVVIVVAAVGGFGVEVGVDDDNSSPFIEFGLAEFKNSVPLFET